MNYVIDQKFAAISSQSYGAATGVKKQQKQIESKIILKQCIQANSDRQKNRNSDKKKIWQRNGD